MDLVRSKSELVAENALLRQQLIILRRQVQRPACTKTDRMILVLLARASHAWKQALFIVQPETLLRGPRQRFKLYWKYKSRVASAKPKISAETVALIKEMARDNRLWGAERIRGELLKLGIHVSKRTIQKYMRHARTPRRRGQTWATFLQNHAKDMWACDFLQVTDLFFRSLFAFFSIELHSRKVIHVGVTRSPTDAWTARADSGSHRLWSGSARISFGITIASLGWASRGLRKQVTSRFSKHRITLRYLAKPCLSSHTFGQTVLVSSGPCLVDEPTLNNRGHSKREADASAQGVREHSSEHPHFLDPCVKFLTPYA